MAYDPVSALMGGLGLMIISIVGALLLFILTGWDDERHGAHRA